jgi:hypothetical protein
MKWRRISGHADLLWLFRHFLIFIPATATAQWHIETFIGPVKVASHDVEILQRAEQTALVFHDVAFRGNAFKEPLYYGIRIGAFLKKRNWLGFEIEFIHNKAYARTERTVHVTGALRGIPYDSRIPMNALLQDFSISHGDNLALANAVLQKRWWKLIWRGRLGFGLAIPHTESTFEEKHREQYEAAFPAAQVALGLVLKNWRHVQVMAEYKFSFNSAREVRIADGHANTWIIAHHFVAGVGLVF